MSFNDDNAWQRKMRDAILKPYYYDRFHAGCYEFIEPTDPRSKGGVDTILRGRGIDEKIVRWPRDEDGLPRANAYDAFALETWSCTIEGHERKGWMFTNTVPNLGYCFSDQAEQSLDYWLLDFAQLKQWFYAEDHMQWPRWRSNQFNRTECRIVPIVTVCEHVRHKRFRVSP